MGSASTERQARTGYGFAETDAVFAATTAGSGFAAYSGLTSKGQTSAGRAYAAGHASPTQSFKQSITERHSLPFCSSPNMFEPSVSLPADFYNKTASRIKTQKITCLRLKAFCPSFEM